MFQMDLKARLKNKTWWVSMIGIVMLVAKQCGLDLSQYLPSNYADIINNIFIGLAMLGIQVDTSTNGVSDIVADTSVQATSNVVETSNTDTSNTVVTTDTITDAKVNTSEAIATVDVSAIQAENETVKTENENLKAQLANTQAQLAQIQSAVVASSNVVASTVVADTTNTTTVTAQA